jgi:hypothetical protein
MGIPFKPSPNVLAYTQITIKKDGHAQLRVLDSMQLTARHQVATPVNWKKGDDVIIVPTVTDEQAKAKYPQGWKTLKPYLRIVNQPTD